ncbi:MAG: NAD(P)-binding domain-containing protein [candidate division KSB1 bacterium]|nr:NAD(P)-binding domain-containing protein [candidate division KSB1 bacterium]MDZ7367325.1 NAD(P)-binding domain-containing protein [candidate division KSB1 bacterium]MDZ7405836.1 NAD(P)-binding domain-containing protein [candidate division KSB1 bacterium]
MKIAIIGAGNVGRALASGWARAGHEVILGVRKLEDVEIKALVAANKNIGAKSVSESAKDADVILSSVPVAAINDVAKSLGEIKNKIIIDATNSVFQKPEPYAHGVEAFKALTKCEDVVKCFNSTGFENMANPKYGDIGIDMFVAGSSQRGKAIAQQLAKDLGFAECYDFGGDDKIALLEQFALAWINLAIMQKHGRGMAFKILKR